MTQRHRRRSATATLLCSALTGVLALPWTVTQAQARAATIGTPVPGQQKQYDAGIYVIKLSAAPVAAYQGGVAGVKRTMPAPGDRLDAGSAAVRKYRNYLDDRRDKVLGAVPGVKKLYDYDYTFNGFAARLTGEQAAELAATPGVVSVTRSTVQKRIDQVPSEDAASAKTAATGTTTAANATSKNTTAENTTTENTTALPDVPRFLGLSGEKGLWSKVGGPQHAGEGVIVGVIDAVDTKNPMLAPLPEPRPDADIIAKKWHGDCDEGDGSAPQYKITCNNRVIGAGWFRQGVPDPQPVDVPSPLDMDSHGTHIGTTIGGAYDTPASIPGTNISGSLSGLAPASRLAFYKACWSIGCPDVDTAAAVERAVADGVDVISYSIGSDITQPTVLESMFNAARAGVSVVTAAGNSGLANSVEGTAPWVTTVAAESHDTGYEISLVLGDGSRVTSPGMSLGTSSAPLVNALDVTKADADPERAPHCAPGTLDPERARGKIVVCDRGGPNIFTWDDRVKEALKAGATGLVVANTPVSAQDLAGDTQLPTITVGPEDREKIKEYAATEGATAELTPTVSTRTKAPVITDFSSAGADRHSTGDLLKPDIAAPGRDIAAGTVPGDVGGYAGEFGFMNGTSMAAPHIAGLTALLKQVHPDWSPMEIKSALMTTATTTDNDGDPLRRTAGGGTVAATPLDYGAGSPRATRAADPGLVYDSTSADWTAYLCAIGVQPATADGTDACATVPKTDPSDLNYPSVSIGDLYGTQTVTRTVTNVSAKAATYRATLQTPPGYRAEVTPDRLTLAPGDSAAYKVTLTREDAAYDTWSLGSLTWSDRHSHHRVTSPLSVRAARFSAPREASADGGSTTLDTRVGFSGELTARARLFASQRTTGTLTGTDTSYFWEDPHTGPAVAKTRLHVAEDAEFARVAITAADHLPGSDLDLYVVDSGGTIVSPDPTDFSDHHADLGPGDYDVYVVQYTLPENIDSQRFTLHTWIVSPDDPGTAGEVTPATQKVTGGDRPRVTVAWPGAVFGELYLGLVDFGDGTETVGRTTLFVRP
ncbi:S8 family serine peptidase [Streptomyces sp. NPDC002643]